MTNVVVLSNIAALRAYSGGSASPAIWIEGYTNPGDGGEGMFTYVPSDTTSSDNGGTIILDHSSDRYYREQHLGPLNILWFGGFTNGSSDNTTALTNALVALSSEGGEIFFPPGKYLFNSKISFSFPSTDKPYSVLFRGSGQNATTLEWLSTDGISLTLSDPSHTVHFRDMGLASGAVGTHTAITVTQSSLLGAPLGSDFTNLTFLGYPTQSSGCWNYAINISGLSFVNYSGVIVYGLNISGNGITIAGNGSLTNKYIVDHNLTGCTFSGVLVGFVYGDYVQGVTISQCNFGGQANAGGVNVVTGANGVLSQLTISDCQFGAAGNQIVIGSSLGGLLLSDNLVFVQPNSTGLVIEAAANLTNSTITGNSFSGTNNTDTTGIFSINGSSSTGNIIIGNSFYNLLVGIALGTSSSNWNVQANVYNNVPNKVINSGTGNSVGVATD